MPSVSKRQRAFMGADLARLRRGEPTKTGMSERQLEEFARSAKKSTKGSPPASAAELRQGYRRIPW